VNGSRAFGRVDNQAAREAVRTLKHPLVPADGKIGAVYDLHEWLAAGYSNPSLHAAVMKQLRHYDPVIGMAVTVIGEPSGANSATSNT
jgi:hypothetical protein